MSGAYLLSAPALIRDTLVTNQRSFHKGRGLERSRRLLGDGLLTSEDDRHRRQRRLIQPAFHRDRIAAFAGIMTACAGSMCDNWRDGQTIDVAQEMNRLALTIVGKTLFGADVTSHADDVGRALTVIMDSFWTYMLPFADGLEYLPLPAFRRNRRARADLDAIIYGLIDERRRHPGDRDDLLSMLILARDEESNGAGMSDQQLRDELMTIFLAGHETTANALAWTWYLLGTSPDAVVVAGDEVARVLGGRVATVEDLPSLPALERVLTESLRLYPPAWIIGRRAIVDCRIGDYDVARGALVLMSPYVVHRDARLFDEPDRFIPDRWSAEFRASLPPFAYFPFGGGARRCIGDGFAWMELMLVAATVLQKWRFEVVERPPSGSPAGRDAASRGRAPGGRTSRLIVSASGASSGRRRLPATGHEKSPVHPLSSRSVSSYSDASNK